MGRQHWRNCKEQRLYLLRKLNYFSVNQKILTLFLQIFYWECSVILFHLLVSQLGSEEQEQPAKNCPYRLQDNCSAQRDLALFCKQQILRKARSILTKKDHILNQEFTTLPSGRRLRCPICKTNRFKNSFMPVAVRLLNNTWSVHVNMKCVCVCVCVRDCATVCVCVMVCDGVCVWLYHGVCVWYCFNCCVWYFNCFTCDLNFIIILWWSHNCSIFITLLWLK